MNGSLNGETKRDPHHQSDANLQPDGDKNEYDDLTKIDGIGEITQQTFRNHAIYTYQDLANSPDETVEAAVKAAGRSIASDKIALWRQEAAQLAANKPRSQTTASFLLVLESGSWLTVRHIKSDAIHTFAVADLDDLKRWMMRYVDANQDTSSEVPLTMSAVDQNTQTEITEIPLNDAPTELPPHLAYLRYDPNPQRERLLSLIAKANRLAGKR